MDKYHPGYFGKVGMRYFHKTQQKFWKPVVNLDKVRLKWELSQWKGVETNLGCLQLWSLVPSESREKYLKEKKSGTAPVLDLLSLGYSKVLGKGRLPEVPIVVQARYFSKEAERKIKDAGGVCQLVA